MSSAGGSMQRRRYTITAAAEQKNDYPEHLNPFREENEDVKTNNKFSSLGRRNTRLTASLRLKSWFPSKSSKPDQPDTDSPTKSKDRFLTLTPKISRQIKEAFTHKRSKNKSDANLAPIPQYVPIRKPVPDQFVGGEFTLSPRASRERYAAPSTSATPVEEGERRSESPAEPLQGVQPPKPLPRTILPKVTARVRVEDVEDSPTKPPASPDGDSKEAPTSGEGIVSDKNTLKITEEDNKYVRQGARPKKKRQAPLPPTRPSPSTSCTVVNETTSTDLPEEISQSATVNSDCPSPNAEPSMVPEVPESAPNSSTSPTEVTKEDRLI